MSEESVASVPVAEDAIENAQRNINRSVALRYLAEHPFNK